MQIVICDDLEDERSALRRHIHAFAISEGLDYVIEDYDNAESLLADVKSGKIRPDIVFMDIYMEGMSGMEAAKQMIADGFSGGVIFTTTSESHSIESYKMMADGYLLKPYTREEFNRNFERALRGYTESFKTVSFPCDRLEFRVYQKDLECIQSNGRGSILYAKGEIIRTTKSVAEFNEELSEEASFFRCHQSCLINLNFVTSVEEECVIMNCGVQAPFVLKNKGVVKKAVSDYFFLKMREG